MLFISGGDIIVFGVDSSGDWYPHMFSETTLLVLLCSALEVTLYGFPADRRQMEF